MIDKPNKDSSENLSKYIVKGIQEKKGTEIVILDLKAIKNAIADYFIICSGNSDTQIDAISESVEKEVFQGTRQDPWHKEGFKNKEWILLDYVDIVVHIFKKDVRKHFSIEDLWGDAVHTLIED